MIDQHKVARQLERLPHVRPEMCQPTLEYHLNYKQGTPYVVNGQLGEVLWDMQIRLSGEPDTRDLPGPPEAAIIGSNGRCTETGKLHCIGLDIDGPNHDGTGNPPEVIEDIAERLKSLPWVYVIRSKSGKGLHVYVFPAREFIAADNPEAIAYGRAMVQHIADKIGQDFAEAVDCAGGMMFYHAPQPGPNGFEILHEPTELYTGDLQPEYNLRDAGEQLATLETEHKPFVEWMEANALKSFVMISPTLCKCHTSDIRRAYEAEILKGTFETVATGRGDDTPNCFVYAIAAGRWVVSNWGGDEPSWHRSTGGICYWILNEGLRLRDYAVANNLPFNRRAKSYCLPKANAEELAASHGRILPNCPTAVMVQESREQLVFEAKGQIEGWTPISDRKCAIVIPLPTVEVEPMKHVRPAYVPGGKGIEYFRRIHNGWHPVPVQDASTKLQTLGLSGEEIDNLLTTDTPYELVTIPFGPEFPGQYQWNTCRTQLAFPVSETPGDYLHFQKILDHVGKAFDSAVRLNTWCQKYGIRTGAEYLFCWLASLFQNPRQLLPGVGLYSEDQDCGKSAFGGIPSLLMTGGGYCNSIRALTRDFNGQLEGVIVLDLDDADLAEKNQKVYNRLLPLMTADQFGLEAKGQNERQVPNYLHFIHSANNIEKFVVQPGDSRWILGEVSPLESLIPKPILTRALVKEAPFFLNALCEAELPEPAGRLFLPILETPLKNRLMYERNTDRLSKDDKQLVESLKGLASGDWLTHEQISRETGMDYTPQKFGRLWPLIACTLEAQGYQTGSRANNGGAQPAAWAIHAPDSIHLPTLEN